jgi:hypothetical protein
LTSNNPAKVSLDAANVSFGQQEFRYVASRPDGEPPEIACVKPKFAGDSMPSPLPSYKTIKIFL